MKKIITTFLVACLAIIAWAQPVGDILDAARGESFTGVLYTRDSKILYNELDLSGQWHEEVLLGDGSAGRITMDQAGNPHVVYATNAKIGYRKKQAQEWSEEVLIESNNLGGTGSCSKPDIAVDASGSAHITYTDSHGSEGDDYTHPDIMYTNNTSGEFVKTLIYRGYRDFPSSGYWAADYFNKGSFICLNSTGDYFILSHQQNIWKTPGFTDNTYSLKIKSNLGEFSISNYGTDIYDLFDLKSYNNKVYVLYKETGFKSSELVTDQGPFAFTGTRTLASSSVSSLGIDYPSLVVSGKQNQNLYTNYNSFAQVYPSISVKGNNAPVVSTPAGNLVFYTDALDNKIKYTSALEPLSFASFGFAEQTGPAKFDFRNGTIELEVNALADLTNLVANFSTTTDVTNVTTSGVPQESGVTSNDFSSGITYTISDMEGDRYWTIIVTREPMYYEIEAYADPVDAGIATGGGTYLEGSEVTLTASTNEGYMFLYWSEGEEVVSFDTNISFLAELDRALVAHFAPTREIEVVITGPGAVAIDEVPYTQAMVTIQGAELTLEALPGEKARFEGWYLDEELVSTGLELVLLLDEDILLEAKFIQQYSLTITIEGNGVVKWNNEALNGEFLADEGTLFDLEAIAEEGWVFLGWSGDLVENNPMVSLELDVDKSIQAVFELFVSSGNSLEQRIKVLPNPFVHSIHLENAGAIHSLCLRDATGKIVWQQKSPVNHEIDLGFLAEGIYFLSIERKDRSAEVNKLVKLKR